MRQNFNMTYVWWNEKGETQYSPEFRHPRDFQEWMMKNHTKIEEQERKNAERIRKEAENAEKQKAEPAAEPAKEGGEPKAADTPTEDCKKG